ncbi:MAG: ABC transporter ATP-binding protein [Actinobacteria bacterium]|nr:ABC transporter ATP-binding protein [Actinomycetota bacterium]MBV9935688.1 ABC transporter ATP-binding protein [Actinomycetota bacterium]
MPELRVEEVEVRFGGLTALQGVDLEAQGGRVTGLIGPNGAGKTTLFNVITGMQAPTRGKVFIDDVDVTDRKTHQRARLRVARTFQRLEVFGSLTARENIRVAADARNGWSGEKDDAKAATEAILERVGLQAVANDPVDSMPTGLARLVELGRAMATKPRLLLLDEPGSGLDHDETESLGTLLQGLAAEGVAILLVEHDVELVMGVCDDIYVLDFGRLIAHGPPGEIQANKTVQAAYLGAEDDALEEGVSA